MDDNGGVNIECLQDLDGVRQAVELQLLLSPDQRIYAHTCHGPGLHIAQLNDTADISEVVPAARALEMADMRFVQYKSPEANHDFCVVSRFVYLSWTVS